MSVDYSFKHRFSWPLTAGGPTIFPTGSMPTAGVPNIHMAGMDPLPPYQPHGHYYSRRMFRPRFGLLRRMLWFGLGVGAASWYINKKQRQREYLLQSDQPSSITSPSALLPNGGPAKPSWKSWNDRHDRFTNSTSQVDKPKPTSVFADLTTTSTPTGVGAISDIDLATLRSTLDRLMREKSGEIGEVQMRAKIDAKEYAREGLERLSKVLDGLKDSLKVDVETKNAKDGKLV